jgi:Family of unknown function (DUF6496)
MPDDATTAKAELDRQEGKSPSTQAGEFVKEEIGHIRHGVHGARSTKQAIAIGLSKARRAGVDIPDSPNKSSSGKMKSGRKKRAGSTASSRKRARASLKALRREGSRSASKSALSRFAKANARKRGPRARHQAAEKAAATRKRGRSSKS